MNEMTNLQRAVLALVGEVEKEKQSRHVFPGEVLSSEINKAVSDALAQLVAMGALRHRLLSVNQHNAYSVILNVEG